MMNPIDLTRLHSARMANTETGYRMEAMRPRFEALRTRHEDGTAPRAIAAFQLFQTPETLAARMVELADICPIHHVLEPSAGLGRLLVPILARNPASVTACEIDAEISGELFKQFPSVILAQGDFLERQPTREGNAGLLIKPFPNAPPFFDRIVMNPPFHMRADIRHTLHALKMLRLGGTLTGLCMSGPHREATLRPLCDVWETIPAGTFRAEGTNVETALFRIRK